LHFLAVVVERAVFLAYSIGMVLEGEQRRGHLDDARAGAAELLGAIFLDREPEGNRPRVALLLLAGKRDRDGRCHAGKPHPDREHVRIVAARLRRLDGQLAIVAIVWARPAAGLDVSVPLSEEALAVPQLYGDAGQRAGSVEPEIDDLVDLDN